MKNKIKYLLIICIIYSIFYPITKQMVFKNYIIDAAKKYITVNKILDLNKENAKAELPVLTLKKENYIKYLIESPSKNIDVNSYYVELLNKNGKIKYKLKYRKEG